MRKKVTAAIVIVALVVGGGWWYESRSAKAKANQSAVRYITTKLRRGDINASISGTGAIASVNGVTVKSNQSGTVTQILAKDGDHVKAGQVIMVLDNTSLKGKLQQAQVDLQTTRTNLDNLFHPQDTAVQAQRVKVENARLTLQQRQQDVANLTVTAPAQGVVASVNTTAGSSVNSGALLFTVFDDSAPQFVVGLSQQAAAAVKVGSNATVDLTGFGKVTGTVQQSGGSATPGNGNRDASVPVIIALPATQGIRPGMVGSAVFEAPGLTYVVQGNGSVKNAVTEVRAQVAGTVAKLNVGEGARVSAGDVMASLTNDNVPVQLKQAQNDLATQEQNLVNLMDPTQDPSGQVSSLKSKLDSANITLTSAQSDVDDLQVKAPVDGVISSLTPRIGDKITNNQSLFRVADYGNLQVTIAVDELDIAKVAMGQPATLTLDALPGKTYTGKVFKINPEGTVKNDIATFDVTVSIDKADGLMAGMNSTVNVQVQNKAGVNYLPAQAVRTQQGKSYVTVLNADKTTTTQKEVQVGLKTANQIEITGGITENDEVVVTTIRSNTSTGAGGFGGLFGGNRQQQGGADQGGANRAGGFTGGQGGGNFGGSQGGGNFQRSGGNGGSSSNGR